MDTQRRVVLLALESLEPSLLRQGVDEGWLPTIAEFLGKGRSVLLGGPHRVFPFSSWPTTLTGTTPDLHGLYHFLQIRPGSYSVSHISESDLKIPPFWRYVSDAGLLSTICDIHCGVPLQNFNGIQVYGWGSLDPYTARNETARSDPSEVLGRLRKEVPGRRVSYIREPPQTPAEFGRMRDEAVSQTQLQARGLKYLLESTPSHLFAGGFHDIHEAPHQLWFLHDPAWPERDPAIRAELGDAVIDLYKAADQGLATVLEAVPEDALVFLLGATGMRTNSSSPDYPAIVLEAGGWQVRKTGGSVASRGIRTTLRRAAHRVLSPGIRKTIGSRLPEVRARYLADSFFEGIDWSATRAFALPSDYTSYIRVNLAGREPNGIVQPGSEFDDVVAEISEAFKGLVHDDDGTPVIEEIVQVDEAREVRQDGPTADIVVIWGERPPRMIRGDGLAPFALPKPVYYSGAHTSIGFLAAAGPGLSPGGSAIDDGPMYSLCDLAPTVLSALGVEVPAVMAGRPISEMLP
ncbi:MAG: alkaline phosphatase family protein [Actinomycetota bacterium]